MIIGRMIKDDDLEVAELQHDVYAEALGIIVFGCNAHANHARVLLDDSDHPEWGTIERCDHRTIQYDHDMLAGAWRFQHDFRQAMFGFYRKRSLKDAPIIWLNWLREEVDAWHAEPQLVRSVQLILTNQNKPRGYRAESSFCFGLLTRHWNVAWASSVRKAVEEGYRRGSEKPESGCAGA